MDCGAFLLQRPLIELYAATIKLGDLTKVEHQTRQHLVTDIAHLA
jgi:hypothetical protein